VGFQSRILAADDTPTKRIMRLFRAIAIPQSLEPGAALIRPTLDMWGVLTGDLRCLAA
jgi:hypothetical protein